MRECRIRQPLHGKRAVGSYGDPVWDVVRTEEIRYVLIKITILSVFYCSGFRRKMQGMIWKRMRSERYCVKTRIQDVTVWRNGSIRSSIKENE